MGKGRPDIPGDGTCRSRGEVGRGVMPGSAVGFRVERQVGSEPGGLWML